MIYLENTSEPQLLIVPNNGTIKAGYYPATLSWDVGIGSVDNAAFRISLAKRVVATLRLRELTFNWWDETGRWEIFWIPGGIPPDPLTMRGNLTPWSFPAFPLISRSHTTLGLTCGSIPSSTSPCARP